MANLLMFDDVTVSLLPSGYSAYAGYVDGIYANVGAIKSRFPNAHVLAIDVNASNIAANCLDVEPGDATNSAAVSWTKKKLAAKNGTPVLYTSAGNAQALINALAAAGISRSQYLLWTAHYNGIEHICGSDSYPKADGTQFTDRALSKSLDESLVSDAFFGSPVTTTFPIKQGQSGTDVATVQGRLNTWAFYIGLKTKLATDGSFGPATEAAVKLALAYFNYSAANIAKGQVDQSLWDHLLHNPAALPLKSGVQDDDPVGPVHVAQKRLNAWAKEIGLSKALTVDGDFGPATLAAVKLALKYWNYSAANQAKGEVDQSLWGHLAGSPAVTPPAPPKPETYPAPGGFKVTGFVTLPLVWEPVSLNGKSAPSYTVAVYLNGQEIGTKVTTAASTSVVLGYGKSYEIHVWANGGPSMPPVASLKVTV